MDNPFAKYCSVREEEHFVTPEIFRPQVTFHEGDFSLLASTPRRTHTIYDIRDITNHRGNPAGAEGNFKGIIGEKILYVVLDELVNAAVDELRKKYQKSEVLGEVLKESEAHTGKGFVATYNNRYILRYHGRTNFVILEKTPLVNPDSWYQQEKLGLRASEIDGLAYLHIGDDKYLLVGEVKTITNWQTIRNSGYYEHATKRLFVPFQSLFPRHGLVFVYLGNEDIIFDGNQLRPMPHRLTERLDRKSIKTIFIPFPPMPKTLEEYAQEMFRMLPLTRKVIHSLGER